MDEDKKNKDNKKLIVVVGGTGGIGSVIYKTLREDASIRVLAISKKGEEGSIKCDIKNREEVELVFERIKKNFGLIYGLVNCAGITSHEKGIDVDINTWDEILAVNLTGVYLCCKQVVPMMIKNKEGRIINIGSIAGKSISKISSVAYTCSKYGVIGLTRQLANDYAEKNIMINCLCPSQTETDMLLKEMPDVVLEKLRREHPSRRLAKPEDIAGIVAFLLTSNSVSYINGAVIDVNGGLVY